MLSRGKRENDLPSDVAKALKEWQNAQKYFESVSDPDLVDVAIYDIEAAKRRYMYMLKCVKQSFESRDSAYTGPIDQQLG